jgi:phospholipid/cholesterol/gamma-HCH transport system substrate-binding protein
MRLFEERDPLLVGVIGVAITLGAALTVLNYDKLPFVNQNREYSAYFADAGGLTSGAAVQVSGCRVGQVESISLDGPRVVVTFHVSKDVRLGDRTEAAVKTKTVLGAKILEVTPRGDNIQSGPIPLDRTRAAYQLPDALGDLTTTISGLDTKQLSSSLAVLADTFHDTPEDLKVAIQGVARFSGTLDRRDAQLRKLLENAKKATGVLAQRSDEVVSLIAHTNGLLAQLRQESSALDHISADISAAFEQIKQLIGDDREILKPSLDKLNGVLTLVDNRKAQVQESIRRLNKYAISLGESVSSGPFFKAYLVNLLPGQFVQPFVDAAFSDLGLDPNVLLPSQSVDPQTGQPATPPLPLPYPRTGQGGEPRLTLPGAVTGKPGDPRYPYRQPPPAPPPGGPPPGPPALNPPGARDTPPREPSPIPTDSQPDPTETTQ